MTSNPFVIGISRRESAGRRAGALPVLALALLAPVPARANTGIGLFGQISGVIFLALVPVIVVEALVLWRLWKVGIGRALWWMTLANLASTLAGAFIGVFAEGIYVDSGRRAMLGVTAGGMVAGLLFLFVTSWLVEWGIIRGWRPQGAVASARRVALVANGVSYALIVAALFAFPRLREPPMMERTLVFEGLTEMHAAKSVVAENFQSQRGFPEPQLLSANPHGRLRSLKLQGEGRLVGELKMPGRADLDGKTLVLAPRLQEGRIAEWTCRAPDVPDKYLPANCRQGQATPRPP